MKTASRLAQQQYVLDSSQNAGMLASLRAQMADRERGLRIKSLRKEKAERHGRKVTQPAMAEAAGVSLRAAQQWEYGGGIDDEHLPKLLAFLETDANYLLRGARDEDEPETPDLITSLNGDGPQMQERLDEINRKLDELLRRTAPAAPAQPEREGDGGLEDDLDELGRESEAEEPPAEAGGRS